MSKSKADLKANLIRSNNAIITHAKAVLILLALLCIIRAANLFTSLGETFIPDRYIYYQIFSSLVLVIPSIIVFKLPKIAFIIGSIFGILLFLNGIVSGDFTTGIINLYIFSSCLLGFFTLLKQERIKPNQENRDDILDSQID